MAGKKRGKKKVPLYVQVWTLVCHWHPRVRFDALGLVILLKDQNNFAKKEQVDRALRRLYREGKIRKRDGTFKRPHSSYALQGYSTIQDNEEQRHRTQGITGTQRPTTQGALAISVF